MMKKTNTFRNWMRKENLSDYDVDVIRDGLTIIKCDNSEIIRVVMGIPTLDWQRESRILPAGRQG